MKTFFKTFVACTVFLFSMASQASGGSLDASANKMLANINSRNFHSLWESVSGKSKVDVSKQLTELKKTVAGKKLISANFNIALKNVDSLSTEDYFVAILNSDKTAGVVKTILVKIEDFGSKAAVSWIKGKESGVSSMVKENGVWYVDLDEVQTGK